MEILQRTNDLFREKIRVRVVRVETLTTIWVRIEGWSKITETLNWKMLVQPMAYWPKAKSLRPGMLVAMLANFEGASFWDRAILLQQKFDSVVATEICEDGTMGQENPLVRRARPSEPSAETLCGPTFYVETVRMSGEHRPFPRRSNGRKVTVGPGAGRIPKRHGSTLIGAGLPRSWIIATLARFFFCLLYILFYVYICIFVYTLVLLLNKN